MHYFFVVGLAPRFPWLGRMKVELWRPLRQWVYARDGGICQYCHEFVELTDAHIHHVLPISEGGVNHPSNLKTLCPGCHKTHHPHMRSARDRLRALPG